MEKDINSNSWFKRLKSGLSASSNKVVNGISSLFTDKKLDNATLEELEDLLITSDLGVSAANQLTKNLAAKKFDRAISEEDIRVSFANDFEATPAGDLGKYITLLDFIERNNTKELHPAQLA